MTTVYVVGKYAFTNKEKYHEFMRRTQLSAPDKTEDNMFCLDSPELNDILSKRQGQVLIMAMVQPFRNSVTFTDCTDYSIIDGIDVYPGDTKLNISQDGEFLYFYAWGVNDTDAILKAEAAYRDYLDSSTGGGI